MATDIDIASGQPPTREVPAVRVEAVYKYYGEFTALNEIDLKVERGERIVVCGPSGSGKSTLIRCINHIEKHDQGLIYVNGTELDHQRKNIDAIRRDTGMVFQSFNLFPHMTTLENSRFGFRNRPESFRGSYRADSSSASRLRAHSACGRRSCCSTSRLRHSIRRWSRKYWRR